jgi:hypothetical protein
MQFILCHFLATQLLPLLLLLRSEPILSFQPSTQPYHREHCRWQQRLPQQQRQRQRRQWSYPFGVTIFSAKNGNTGNTGTKKKDSSPTRIRKSKPRNNNSKKTDGRQHDRPNDYPPPKDPTAMETWRIYGISVHPDDLVDDVSFGNSTTVSSSSSLSSSIPSVPRSLQNSVQNKLKIQPNNPLNLSHLQIVRRSLDSRKKLAYPVYNYVVDISLSASQRYTLRWRPKPGRMEQLESNNDDDTVIHNDPLKVTTVNEDTKQGQPDSCTTAKKTVVIVGMGPAGLFCALQLALKSNNTIRPILLDRGQPVEKRGRDIGALMHRRSLDGESNFAFGEGAAGTGS